MYPFTLERPSTVADAAKLVTAGAKPLAGGQTLLASMKLRLSAPERLVDLGGIKELTGITKEGDAFLIRTMSQHLDERSDVQLGAAGDKRHVSVGDQDPADLSQCKIQKSKCKEAELICLLHFASCITWQTGN